jgi:3-dehydroquinate dehydratase II
VILLVNGPNLNLLGEYEPEMYGRETLADVERMVREACAGYGVEVMAFQSNAEGALLDFIQAHRHGAEGIILNPGALAHTSRALPDCLSTLGIPVIEVHVPNIHAPPIGRGESLLGQVARGQVIGLGVRGYYYAAVHLCALVAQASEGRGPSGAPPFAEQLARASARAAGAPPASGSGELEPPGSGEEIPEDLAARGDYEPL